MSNRKKLLATAIVLFVATIAVRIFAPVAQQDANATIVQQMDGSNQSALAAHLIGSGSWMPDMGITVIAGLLLLFIWTRKPRA